MADSHCCDSSKLPCPISLDSGNDEYQTDVAKFSLINRTDTVSDLTERYSCAKTFNATPFFF